MVEIDGNLRIVLGAEDRDIYISDSDESYCAISIDERDGLKLTILLMPKEARELLRSLMEAVKRFED